MDMMGQNIKKKRLEMGMTQAELAEKAGLSNVHISHLETGSSTVSLESLVNICKALETTPDYILLGQYSITSERVASMIQSKDLTQDELGFVVEFVELLSKRKINRIPL